VAEEDDASLLGLDAGAPLLVVRRLAVGPDGPLALALHRYVAHRFSLDVDLAGWPDDRPVHTLDRRAP
jgi:GntR family transcriptional regulator